MLAVESKLLPFTVSVKSVPAAVTLSGEIELITGSGSGLIVTVAEADLPGSVWATAVTVVVTALVTPLGAW
jgi:hypothetical protein